MADHTFIDLFSGAGLFSAGFVQAGLRPVLALDVDRLAIESYRRNVSSVAKVGSVADKQPVPKADVVIAGPPCQGFSTLGRQDPLDARNQLSSSIPAWIRESGCKIAVIENVPPYLGSSHWQALAKRLRGAGFSVTTWVLDAVDFGAPQLRKRAFTIASRIGPVAAPSPSGLRIPASIAFGPVAADDPLHTWPAPSDLAAARFAVVPPKGDKRDIMRDAPHLAPASWPAVGCNATDVWGRIDETKPANTIRCTFQNPSKGRYLHPEADRVISLREGARLQGVPDSWTFAGRPYPIARQIGNGVPIPLAAAVARSVAQALQRQQGTSSQSEAA